MPGNPTPFLRLHELALLRLDTQSSLLLTSLDLYLVLYHDIQAQVVPLLHPLFSSTHWQKITHQSRMSLTRWKACCTQKGKKIPPWMCKCACTSTHMLVKEQSSSDGCRLGVTYRDILKKKNSHIRNPDSLQENRDLQEKLRTK